MIRRIAARPSLLASFALTSLAVVIGIGLLVGVVLQDTIRNRAITDAARTGEVAANVGVRPFLQVDDLLGDFRPLSDERIASLDESLGTGLSPDGVVRIKVWNRQHWLVYSDNPQLLSRWFPGTDTLERSFAGELTSEITDLTAPEEREERDFGELLAVYVPLRTDDRGAFTNDASGEVIGAFEIYLPFEPIAASIASDTQRLWAALAIGLSVLYLALYRIVARASRRLRVQAEENLRLATHDTLTGLVNRDAFLTVIESQHPAMGPDDDGSASEIPAVVMIDLDRFHQINDTLGHEVGDRLLQLVGERLVNIAGPESTVARLGGDQFGVLLPDGATAAPGSRLDRLLAAFDDTIEISGFRLDVHATHGIAEVTPQSSADVVLRHADIALKAAKDAHLSIERFRSDMHTMSPEVLELAADVRTAIDEGQFVLHYQPKYDLRSRLVCGAEALLRWQHPQRGAISPGTFMPIVEQLPVCRDVTDHVLDLALGQMAQWRRMGIDVGVSVNLSARDVADPELPEIIAERIRAHGVEGSQLTVELTEGAVLVDERRTIENLERIRSLGCGVSIDDFGTGYASLSYLLTLPVTELKIDQSFVGDLGRGEKAASIVRHCIDIAHALEVSVTAEGIETADVEQALALMGCDVGQGYLRAKPLPYETFVEFMTVRLPAHSTTAPDPAEDRREPHTR